VHSVGLASDKGVSMAKHIHEIRDPIHVFIRLETSERQVLNSRPVQRLRHIHQLALTHFLYPGATHRRFEHSLGVMELAGRVYDIVTDPGNLQHESVREIVPHSATMEHAYWRRVVRMAALCHDIGHLPFSHAAEAELLPADWNHERLTAALVLDSDLKPKWKDLKIDPEHVAKIAVGPKHYSGEPFDDWETILCEIITGNSFGVDRMDYLLRDSHHSGVAYGRFDHFRLIDTLRILPRVVEDQAYEARGAAEGTSATGEVLERTGEHQEKDPESREPMAERLVPTLGIEVGGLHSAEALLLARYFMYTQLYFHPVRRIYDIHLRDFLKAWLEGGLFSTDLTDHLNLTDNEVMAAILAAARDESRPGHDSARRIVQREHFRTLYQRNPNDVAINPDAAGAIHEAAACNFSADNVQLDTYRERNRPLDFPVSMRDDRIVSCLEVSDTLKNVPIVAVDYVYIAPRFRSKAEQWLQANRDAIITPKPEDQP
jgi:HD superfamily phosphohydrolase